MTERTRLHRQDPERTEPIRNFSGLFGQQSAEAGDREATAADHPEGSWQSNVAKGARAGYRVIEEHLKHGEQIAKQLQGQRRQRAAGTGDATQGVQEIIENLGHYYTQTLSAYVDLLQPLLQGGRSAAPATTGAFTVRTASARRVWSCAIRPMPPSTTVRSLRPSACRHP